jgi:hypothetical protein
MPIFGQKTDERYWLAGRYDGNRVLVYFDAVKFEGTMTANAHKIAPPVAAAFLSPLNFRQATLSAFRKLHMLSTLRSATAMTLSWAMESCSRLS